MASPDTPMDPTDTHCPDCGNPFPEEAPLGMCPKCLLGSGLDTRSTDTTIDGGQPETAAAIGELAAPGMIIRQQGRKQWEENYLKHSQKRLAEEGVASPVAAPSCHPAISRTDPTRQRHPIERIEFPIHPQHKPDPKIQSLRD